MADDGVTASSTGNGRWRWQWRSPWGSVHIAPTTQTSEKAALAAGRKWLREHT